MAHFERHGDTLLLFFKHTSNRNFVIQEPILNNDVYTAKATLLKRKKEMNDGQPKD